MVEKGAEKQIEKAIQEFLEIKGAVIEGMNSGKVLIKKGKYNHMMTLNKPGCPDLVCLYQGEYIGIEVKKNEEEVEAWLKKEKRLVEEGELPKSYQREKDQIKYKQDIIKNGGTFILTCELQEVVDYILELEKQTLRDNNTIA